MWKLEVVGLILLGLAQAVVPPGPLFHYRKRADVGGGPDDIRAAGVLAETVELPLDHFGNYPGTFRNRYWVLQEFYKPGSPVFIYDAGETDAELSVLGALVNDTSPIRQMIREFNGMGIMWEHRYYGASTHVNISESTPIEEFRWLTTAQALADVPAFASNFTLHNFTGTDLTPASTPWVFLGGSYPGIRAALVRQKYPETIFASYSSSAPVHAQIDMSVYWDQVYRGMNGMGFKNCTNDIIAVTKYIDGQLSGGNTSAAIKNQYLGTGGANNTDVDFATVLRYIYLSWKDQLMEGDAANLRSFCDWISTDPGTGAVSGAEGWAKSKGAKFTSDRWASWPLFAPIVNYYLNTNCAGYYGNSTTGIPDCQLGGGSLGSDAVSWTYQYCTEWGYFQFANRGPNQMVSSYNSLEYQQNICYQVFPQGLSSGLLPRQPDVDKTNREYGGWDLRPSNVFNTGGEYDTWLTLSLLSGESWAPKDVKLTQDIPEEGASTGKGEVFGYLLKGAGHCFDLGTNLPESVNARKIFTTALRKWLGNFKKKTN